ncbi:MAG TPA: NUDIX hydrolase [Solirubrobacteraceae bacterium]|jgi:8-oxo-dGTP pyrophosphatase MutT (NUDIX family)|nr:NUDIX hydrolase [Solirubrobacteraceae bacterium]
MSAAEPREAATVILLRGERPFQVLMVERNPATRAAGAVWVFPGGGVEDADGSGEGRLQAAAVRELAEEASITGVAPETLIPFGRWIAPVSLPVRFDTHFFLARAPEGQEPHPDGVECIDAGWFTIEQMLSDERAGRFPLLAPTRRNLECLQELEYDSIEPLLEAAGAATVEAVRPRLRHPGDPGLALCPGEPGYDTATG